MASQMTEAQASAWMGIKGDSTLRQTRNRALEKPERWPKDPPPWLKMQPVGPGGYWLYSMDQAREVKAWLIRNRLAGLSPDDPPDPGGA